MPEYILVIAREGRFYCRVELRADRETDAIKQAANIMARFPYTENFSGELTEWKRSGRSLHKFA
jgi:hypothetical protein